MTATAKRSYYRNSGMVPELAQRYFRQFGDARKILDLGCGVGELGRHLGGRDLEIHGVDVDDGALRRAAEHEIAIRFDLNRAPLPYGDASFDAILAKDIFEHLQTPESLAAEAYRLLRPGGVLIASVVMARPRAVWADYTHLRGFTRGAARMLLEDVGFTVEAIWPMGGVPLSRRLRFVALVPHLLRVPPLGHLWGSSWELKAHK